ncbi:MAG: hypothetical protein ACI3X6_02355 [Alloprevotella sp.]
MNRFLRNSILGLSIALLFPFTLQSKPKDCLILHLKSGSCMIFPLKDLPRITVDNDFFTISSKVFDIENVSKYTFGDSEATGIDELKALSPDGFSMDEAGRVWLASASDDTDVKVYNILRTNSASCLSQKLRQAYALIFLFCQPAPIS